LEEEIQKLKDQIAQLQSQIEALIQERDRLKIQLAQTGPGRHEFTDLR